MEHYNAVYFPEKEPGLRIIQSYAYIGMVSDNPGMLHTNHGDFYSDVPVGGLSDVIIRELEAEVFGEKMNSDLVAILSANFNPLDIDEEKDYLISEPWGIRLYAPSTFKDNPFSAEEIYTFVALMFIEKLFSKEKKGSLQLSLEKSFEAIKDLASVLKDK